MASINPTQDYDAIHTLTFTSASGTCKIRLHRGSFSTYTGTVYYRAGTSGAWTSLSVSGNSTTFPVTSTTMQIGHDWNKDGDNYMTPSFWGQSTNLVGISISQKAVLSGTVGKNFMISYADACTSLISLDVPDTSGITSVGDYFMSFYAYNCTSLISLILPAVGWFGSHNVDWSIPSGRLGYLKGYANNVTDRDNWRALTTSSSPNTLYINYIRSADDVILPPTPVVGEKYALPPFRRA